VRGVKWAPRKNTLEEKQKLNFQVSCPWGKVVQWAQMFSATCSSEPQAVLAALIVIVGNSYPQK